MRYTFYFFLSISLLFISQLHSQNVSDKDIIITYKNLSERYESLFKNHENHFRNKIKEKLVSMGRLDVLPVSVTIGASENTPYILYNLTFRGNDHLKYFDSLNEITALDVELPVVLIDEVVRALLWKISNDSNIHWTEVELLRSRHVIIRMTKENGDYIQMYAFSDWSWDTDVCVYQKKYGKKYVNHISNPKVVGAYKLLLFDNPRDELTGKLNNVKYIYEFYGFDY